MAVEIMGLGELRQDFQKLAQTMTHKTAPRMVLSGSKVLRKEARVLAQAQGLRQTGALLRNIAIKRERDVPQGVVQVNLGVRHGRDLGKRYKQLAVGKSGRIVTAYKNNPYYWRFLELGTRHHKAFPFIAPALASKRVQAIRAMGDQLKTELDKLSAI